MTRSRITTLALSAAAIACVAAPAAAQASMEQAMFKVSIRGVSEFTHSGSETALGSGCFDARGTVKDQSRLYYAAGPVLMRALSVNGGFAPAMHPASERSERALDDVDAEWEISVDQNRQVRNCTMFEGWRDAPPELDGCDGGTVPGLSLSLGPDSDRPGYLEVGGERKGALGQRPAAGERCIFGDKSYTVYPARIRLTSADLFRRGAPVRRTLQLRWTERRPWRDSRVTSLTVNEGRATVVLTRIGGIRRLG